jgi:hypothetical protein
MTIYSENFGYFYSLIKNSNFSLIKPFLNEVNFDGPVFNVQQISLLLDHCIFDNIIGKTSPILFNNFYDSDNRRSLKF